MAVKIALTIMAFIIIFSAPYGSSQPVPDGLVYTEIQKTLVHGIQGVLTCRFYGKPWAVYWGKGHDPEDLTPLLVWHVGVKSGPRYSDGSCDIDENYSLIIKNVSTANAGRIYCTVSNYIGILIDNYTDVFVANAAIETNTRVILQMRQSTYGILQCTVHIKARSVSWKKGTTSSANESLVVLENNKDGAERSGTGYVEGMYNITQDYSLIIKKVQVHHEGLYICKVTDFDSGISFRENTFVNVVAQPLKPFPSIQECLNAEEHDSNYCTLVAKSGVTLTCQALKYYPSINLVFLYGSRVLEPSDTREWNNTDGTKNKTITIATSSDKELYTCVASNIPGTSDDKSTSVLLHGEENYKSVSLEIILTLFAALILISSVAYFTWRKKHLNYSSVPRSAPLLELEEIDVKELTKTELQALEEGVDRVLIKHYRRIFDAIETKPVQTKEIICENRTALFDTHQMLADWQQRPTSRISQYRKVFQDAFFVANYSDPALDHTWPSNEELQSISRHLKQESMKRICTNLNIVCKSDDANDEGEKFDSLREWRNKVAEKNVKENHEQLSSALGSTNLKGLLPSLKGQFIYKAELVDMAFHMLMQDLLPFAEALGIHFTKMITYRPAFEPSHLQIGTIDLLSKLLTKIKKDMFSGGEKMETRPLFCTKLIKIQYHNVASLGMFVYEMSYGELFRITEAMAPNTRERKVVKGGTSQGEEALAASKIGPREEPSSLGTPSTLPQGEDREEPDIEKAESVPEQLGESKDNESKMELPKELINLQCVLQLTDEDIANGLETSDPLTAYMLLRLWKEKPRQTIFNYRTDLAYELRKMKMPGLADEVIAGTYITEQTSLAFIEDVVWGLNQDQTRIIGELLQLNRGKQHCHTTTPLNETIKQIYDWVAGWTSGRKDPLSSNALALVNLRTGATAKAHRDLNDKLVEHGFLDLAREIMIIERQLAKL